MKNIGHRNGTLLLGVMLVIGGMGLLSYTAFRVSITQSFWPPILILFGGFLTWRVLFLGGRDFFFFMGMLCIQAGLFGIVNGWFPLVDLRRVWPLFLTMTGATLLFYGYRKKREPRLAIIVPALFFIFLSFVFLPFSLGLARMAFRAFVHRWWPLLVVFLGILLFTNRIRKFLKEKRNDRGKG